MDRDVDRYRSLTRRTLVLGGLQLGMFGLLGARMYQLQVLDSERFAMLADENRINMQLIAPSRGRIFDRAGVDLAVNEQNFRVLLTAEQAGNVEAVLDRLSTIVALTDEDVERVLRDVSRRRSFVPVTVHENLTFEQVAQIEVNAPELPGLSIDVGELRFYPHGEATAHVVGYVGAVSEEELDGDPVLSLPGFKIGKAGIEREHEQVLRGEAGTRRVEVNAVGRIIRELSRESGTPGQDLSLSLDLGLQRFVQDRLSSENSASAVVMDGYTGEVFAMASHPTFDANLFTTGIDRPTWSALINSPYGVLNNKPIGGMYAPGSTFKMLVALAALESGAIDEDHEVYCPGHMDLGNHRFHCWRRWGHGTLGLTQAIAQSCDVFFYDVSLRVGIDNIKAMADRLGIGVPVGIDLPGERDGLVPSHGWMEATRGERWQQGHTLNASIGQGFVLATPLQLAVMIARMINGGRAVRPRITLPSPDALAELTAPGAAPEIGLDTRALALVTDAMVEVTSGPRGTARGSQIDIEGMEMGGKTGTSQVRRITAAERAAGIVRNEDLPWNRRDHALFVGFAPVHAPRYVVSVVVEHGGGGSSVAAPIAADILRQTQQRAPARPLPTLLGGAAAGQPS